MKLRSLVLATGLLPPLVACGPLPVSSQYLDSGKFGVTLAVPAEYQMFTAAELGAPETPATYIAGFAAPGVTPADLLSSSAPGGVTRVTPVPGPMSNATEQASSVFVNDMPELLRSGKASVVDGPTVDQSNQAFEKTTWTFRIRLGAAAEDSLIVVTSIVGTVDADESAGEGHVVKSIAVGCTESCFNANTEAITSILNSWRAS